MIKVKDKLAPKGSNCRPGYALVPMYITIHNTANLDKGAGAERHGTYLSGAGQTGFVSYHYVVDDKAIVRCIPDNEVAWHAGDGAQGQGNRRSLAIEICENPESDIRTATDNAAELTAHLMKDYNLPITAVFQHNHWSGKNCPNRIRKGEPYGWDEFLVKVEAFYTALTMPAPTPTPAPASTMYAVQTGAFKVEGNANAYAATLKEKGIPVYKVKSGAFWRIQTGAFSYKPNAISYAASLNAKGISAVVVLKNM